MNYNSNIIHSNSNENENENIYTSPNQKQENQSDSENEDEEFPQQKEIVNVNGQSIQQTENDNNQQSSINNEEQNDQNNQQNEEVNQNQSQQSDSNINVNSEQDSQKISFEFINIIIENDFNKLMKFFKSLKKNESKICEWRKNNSNKDQLFKNSNEFQNYVILASKNDTDDMIYMQMTVLVNQTDQLIIQDLTFTIKNICLNQNLKLKIGSFIYLNQTNQIFYEIKQFKLIDLKQIKSIIQNAIDNFDLIISQVILLKFKISSCKATNLTNYYFRSTLQDQNSQIMNQNNKSQAQSENFSHSKLLFEKDQDSTSISNNNQQSELVKVYQLGDQKYRNNLQKSDGLQQSCMDSNQSKNKKNQIQKLNSYQIDDQITKLSDKGDLVDQGGFHKIYRITANINGSKKQELAVKNQSSYKLRKEIEFITKFLSNSYSKYIAQIYIVDNKYDYYLLKYYHFKSLRDYQKKYQYVISLKTKLKILKQIVKGIQHLHNHNILHLDIKADNILISKNGNVKICDFGEAYHPQYQLQRDCVKFSVPYSAPEVIKHKTNFLTQKADVFSFGTLAYELVFGKLPIPCITKENYLKLFKEMSFKLEDDNGYLAELGPRQILSELIILIYKCLTPTKEVRPDLQSIYQYLKGIKIDSLNLQTKREEQKIKA